MERAAAQSWLPCEQSAAHRTPSIGVTFSAAAVSGRVAAGKLRCHPGILLCSHAAAATFKVVISLYDGAATIPSPVD